MGEYYMDEYDQYAEGKVQLNYLPLFVLVDFSFEPILRVSLPFKVCCLGIGRKLLLPNYNFIANSCF